MTAAQERALEYFSTQVDKVVASAPNEQENVLYILLDNHHKLSGEGGYEFARILISPSGFMVMAAYIDKDFAEEFNAIYDGYIREVGIVHPTSYE
jgi:hypothetical protein